LTLPARDAEKWAVHAIVAAKGPAPQPQSALADRLLGGELIVPDRLFAEMANILCKKQHRAAMTSVAAHAGARWLLQLPLVERMHAPDAADLSGRVVWFGALGAPAAG
jgi:hypothetical protein